MTSQGALKMSDNSAGEIGQVVAGIGGVLVPVGLAVRWLVQWLSGRNEKRITKLEKEVGTLTARLLIVGEALALLAAEHRHHAPGSEALARAERALKRAFPLDRMVPGDLLDLAAKLDGGE